MVVDYGQNEWLVELMREKYKQDPNSVDESWRKILSAPQPATPIPPEKNQPPVSSKTESPPASKFTKTTSASNETNSKPIKGTAAAIVKNMITSLEIPTATSVRAIPAKLMIENRLEINSHLKRTKGGKISFTHILGYALVQALKSFPNLNSHYDLQDGKPVVVKPEHINLGLAIDLPGKNENRTLVVAAIKGCENLNFREFVTAYEDIVTRARDGKLTAADFAGVTISLTNPGTLGTNHSVPRLMKGQGAIIGVGALDYPAEFQGASEQTIADLGIGKLITLTSTYDHRIIQGAESGDFLKQIHTILISDELYDHIFATLKIPYKPARWRQDNRDPELDKNAVVNKLIAAYRNRGHLIANVDPLDSGTEFNTNVPDLDILNYGLTVWDLDRTFNVGGFHRKSQMTLREVLQVLRDAYCRRISLEYTHILAKEQQLWLQDKMENRDDKPSVAKQKYILSRLNAAEAFETFLQTKYIGQKRFSLEGAEVLIPVIDAAIETAASANLDEVIIGMSHRGRLNVLANIVGKPYANIFNEFEGNIDPATIHGSGDVKYHLGAEGTYYQMFGDNDIRVTLTSNPSHLEAVDPVLEGLTRAKQDFNYDSNKPYSILPIITHGDAAFAGQGVVAETFNLSKLEGYTTGGTIHIVVNNQIGFTTSPQSARSTIYCTDIAKMVGAPIFHVNGQEPESCVAVAELAVQFREKFHTDVVIDLVCYRKRGHNEGDDPSMTQPTLYDKIYKKPSVRENYTKDLIGRGDISLEEAEDALRDYQGQLERVFKEVHELEKYPPGPSLSVEEEQVIPANLNTNITAELIAEIGAAFNDTPSDFTIHNRVKPILQKRYKMSQTGNIDWAFAELLAIGSLVHEGKTVRLAGQDSQRGTFSQRHAVLVDRNNANKYNPLSKVAKDKGRFFIYDSPLSEYAALGFEFGYSLANRDGLTLWEAQYGDFVNVAQAVIDEFISSSEAKWGLTSDLVLLLPHSQEGQGPDHSSARIERFLQLCAEGSMTVAWPTTPANYFHLLRRHAADGIHRPLVVFTPKSMLRMKEVVSEIKEFTSGKFQSIIDDPQLVDNKTAKSEVKKILFTSGKIYYDLAEKKQTDKRTDIAVIRLEQLYPLPFRRIQHIFSSYPNITEICWVQDEPANQGPWTYLALTLPEQLPDIFKDNFKRISRRAMSAPSSGSNKVHAVEFQKILNEAFI